MTESKSANSLSKFLLGLIRGSFVDLVRARVPVELFIVGSFTVGFPASLKLSLIFLTSDEGRLLST